MRFLILLPVFASFLLGNSSQEAKVDDSLLLSQVLFRHGDRTPLIDFPTNPNKDFNYGAKGNGQLTPIGQKQAYSLGCFLRRRYEGFLSPTYSNEEIYVQSSDVDRTIMTAQACLACLFPPTENENALNLHWQPIPVHSLPAGYDNKLAARKSCAKFDKLLDEYLKSSEMLQIKEKNKELYKILEKETGVPVASLWDLKHLNDVFLINTIYNLTLPEWTKGVYPDQLTPAAKIGFSIRTKTKAMKRLYTRKLLEELVENMDVRQDISSGKNVSVTAPGGYPAAKMYLYASHDVILTAFLDALGIYNESMTPPPYTAALMLELLRGDETSNFKPIVQLIYRPDVSDEIFALQIPKCGTPCVFDNFKIKYFDIWNPTPNWENECIVKRSGSWGNPLSYMY